MFIGITQLHQLLRSVVIAKTRHTVLHEHLLGAIKPQRLAYSSVLDMLAQCSDHSPPSRREIREAGEGNHSLYGTLCLLVSLLFLALSPLSSPGARQHCGQETGTPAVAVFVHAAKGPIKHVCHILKRDAHTHPHLARR